MVVLPNRCYPLLLGLFCATACEYCDDPLAPSLPRMVVDPEAVDLAAVGVAQDTDILVTISNPSGTDLRFDAIALDERAGDVNFRIIEQPTEVFPGESEVVRIRVRPSVVGVIETTLILDAEDAALPNYAEVPIRVNALDLGLPDIELAPLEVDFARIGQNDVARSTVDLRNVGVRDLVIDETLFIPDDIADASIRLITPIQPGWSLGPGEAVSLELVFAPLDTQNHTGALVIRSNDPDEPEVLVPVRGRGSQCPVAVAELLDGQDGVEPLDTLRITGEASYAQTLGADVVEWDWRLLQRPVGSTAVIEEISAERVQLTCDLAGDYEVVLTVTDSDGVRSCEDERVRIHVEPSEDLHVQLVWDHESADLDLHMLREDGTIFTHEGDVYFSNREPLDWFPDNPEWVPSLDADDSRGYGPENINVDHPEPGSTWRVVTHYWNKQTGGDAFTIATVRIYAFGQLIAEIPQSFESDQTLWIALDIVWSEIPGAMPQINQIGLLEPYLRPF